MQAEDQRPRTPRPSRQTLPRDFMFHYEESAPKTPEPMRSVQMPTQQDALQPQKLRIKRRRAQPPTSSEFVPLPKIELSSLETDLAPLLNIGSSEPRSGFLAPSATSRSMKRYGRIILDDPKTPLDQMFNVFDAAYAKGGEYTPNVQLEPIARPSSTFSDSSESSSSSDSSPSFGDSCNSPDSDSTETFVFPRTGDSLNRLSSPLNFHSAQKTIRRIKPQSAIRWTSEMDEHLWQTYIAYLADPTMTPFKTLPGTAPPLGVCHRIARDAKKSWRGPRPPLSTAVQDPREPYLSLDATLAHEATGTTSNHFNASRPLRPQLDLRSLSNYDAPRRSSNTWPRSEASTRKRLRELCKHKPTLSPHYQRLMQSRSPSPFDSSSSSKPDISSTSITSPPPQSDESESAFSTREMNISLATSVASSMQPDGPLSQLASGTMKPRPYSTEWIRPAARTGAAHQKSQSLHLSLGIGLGNHSINSFRKLASPFYDNQPLPTMAEDAPAAELFQPTDPVSTEQLRQSRPLSGSTKRRAVHPLTEDTEGDSAENRRSFMEGLFRGPETEAHRRTRSRGFSMGGIGAGAYRHSYTPQTRHLSEIFTPPPTINNNGTDTEMGIQPAPEHDLFTNRTSLADGDFLGPAIQTEHIQRLGSPFAPNGNLRFSQTFPRAVFPHGLETTREEPQTPSRKPFQGRTSSDSTVPTTTRRF